MAVSLKCRGWGKQSWGDDPWGGGDGVSTPLTVTSIQPPCGETGVNPTTPIIITVCGGPCSFLKGTLVGDTIDCMQIKVNGTTVYDGTGLTLVPFTFNSGFKAPCNQACSEVTYEITPDPSDPTYALQICYTFKLCCTAFPCDSIVTVEASFCDNAGNVVDIADCSFKILQCNHITGIEIIDSKHVVVRFANRLLPNPVLNKALYSPSSWNILPVSGGSLTGNGVEVNRVLVEKTFLPNTVILETGTPMTRGAMYEVVGSPEILDIHRQPLISKGKSLVLARATKVDSILRKLPKMYKVGLNNELEDKQKVISIWQIFAAIGIEDERMGGDY